MNISTEALILMIKSDESAAKFNSIDEYRKHLNKFIQFCDLVDKANGIDSENKALHKHSVMPSLHLFKERRDKLNLTLRQVAEQTKVSAATISRIEREEGFCSYHNVVQLDDYYCRNRA